MTTNNLTQYAEECLEKLERHLRLNKKGAAR